MHSRNIITAGNSISSAILLVCLLSSTESFSSESAISVEYLSRDDIANKSIHLTEPSGLALSHENGTLWVISDNSPAIYTFSLEDPQHATRLPIDENEIEGIALVESEGVFFTVNEKLSRIKRFSVVDGKQLAVNNIGRMQGYPEFRATIEPIDSNSGLEGITWHSKKQSLFVIIEGPPGYLLEISPDLKTILSTTELSSERGFVDPEKLKKRIDFSGVSYDAARDKLWILSDQAARVFIYDLASDRVIKSLPLDWQNSKGKRKSVDKAEGISLSPDGSQLFVVSDSEGRLYRWAIVQ